MSAILTIAGLLVLYMVVEAWIDFYAPICEDFD